MIEKLQSLHLLFLALGTGLNAAGAGLPAASKAQIWCLALGTGLMAFGGYLARNWTPPAKGIEQPDGSSLRVLLPLALIPALFLSGCATTGAQWKAAGIDTAKCLAPKVMDAAGDAIIALLNDAAGATVDYKSLGIQLATTYGVQAAICAVGKAYGDLGGASLLAKHGEPRKAFMALDYLVHHQDEWAHQ